MLETVAHYTFKSLRLEIGNEIDRKLLLNTCLWLNFKATTVVLESVLGKVEGDWNSLMRAQADILFSSSGEMWNLQRKMTNQPLSDKLPDN